MKQPCKNCTDRTVEPNCHTDCERYTAFVEERDRIKSVKLGDNKNHAYNDYKSHQLWQKGRGYRK